MSINILRTEQGVNMGEHAQDVVLAVDPVPGETVEELCRRALSRIEYVARTVQKDGGFDAVADPTVYLTIRLTDGALP